MPLTPAGDLDRRIDLQKATSSHSSTGAPVVIWSTVATVWAEIRPASAREFIGGAAEVSEQRTVFRIRFRRDVVTTWRVAYGAQLWEIVGVAEIGRQEGLELQATAILQPVA